MKVSRASAGWAPGANRVCIRPERISIDSGGDPAVVDDVVFVGSFMRYLLHTDRGERLTVVQQPNGKTLARGERVGVSWRNEDAFQLPGRTDE